jgi:hypothetical protein
MPRDLKNQLRNILTDRLVPPGIDGFEATAALWYQIRQLENGVLIDLGAIYGTSLQFERQG